MPYILGLIGIATAAYFLIIRARNAAEMTSEMADVASDIMAAARRFGFRRKYNTHPVDNIEDPKLAVGGIAVAFMQIGSSPTADQKAAMLDSLQSRLSIKQSDAEELDVLGQWFVNECNGPAFAIPRLSKRLYKLSGAEHLEPMMGVVTDTVDAGTGSLSEQQLEALDEVKRAFHVR